MGCSQKSLMQVWRYHQLLSKFLISGHLPRVSRQSHLSANYKCDNDVMPGTFHSFPQFSWHFTYSWRKPLKISARRSSDEGCANSHRLKPVPLPSNEVGGSAEQVREFELVLWDATLVRSQMGGGICWYETRTMEKLCNYWSVAVLPV